jgi:Na+/H+-translocating membrane pyrophosphatase
MIVINEYYTATEYGPVRKVPPCRKPAMLLTSLPTRRVDEVDRAAGDCICFAIYGAFTLGGLYGIAIAATAMLSPPAWWWRWMPTVRSPTTLAASPMAGLPKKIRDIDPLMRWAHHQGRDLALRHRFGRTCGAGAVCRLHQ